VGIYSSLFFALLVTASGLWQFYFFEFLKRSVGNLLFYKFNINLKIINYEKVF